MGFINPTYNWGAPSCIVRSFFVFSCYELGEQSSNKLSFCGDPPFLDKLRCCHKLLCGVVSSNGAICAKANARHATCGRVTAGWLCDSDTPGCPARGGGQPGCAKNGGFLKWGYQKGYPQIIHFRLGFSIINQPFGGLPFMETPRERGWKSSEGRPQHPKCFESAKLHPTAQWCSGATACLQWGEL